LTLTLEIRRAEAADALDLHRFGLTIPELKVSSQIEFMTLEEMQEAVSQTGGMLFLAELDGSLVGFIFALVGDFDRLPNATQACLVYLAVAPECRRQGIAQKLYDQLREELKERGVSYVYAWACPTSGVIDFMKRQGWNPGRTCLWLDKQILGV
jgi:ribosomal protein S18 acetylase RimI-like enzyme